MWHSSQSSVWAWRQRNPAISSLGKPGTPPETEWIPISSLTKRDLRSGSTGLCPRGQQKGTLRTLECYGGIESLAYQSLGTLPVHLKPVSRVPSHQREREGFIFAPVSELCFKCYQKGGQIRHTPDTADFKQNTGLGRNKLLNPQLGTPVCRVITFPLAIGAQRSPDQQIKAGTQGYIAKWPFSRNSNQGGSTEELSQGAQRYCS